MVLPFYPGTSGWWSQDPMPVLSNTDFSFWPLKMTQCLLVSHHHRLCVDMGSKQLSQRVIFPSGIVSFERVAILSQKSKQNLV